jgi:2'-hydroxyisoflavone reductase
MRVLIIGGTQFVGRHITEALIRSGHEVTLFHRGKSNQGVFEDVEHRYGDRNVDLSALSLGEWDVTIDSSAYVPRQVRALAEALSGRGGRYIQISSVSAYQTPGSAGINEDAPLLTLEDPTVEEVTEESYGGLKALCEAAAFEFFGGAETALGSPGVPVSIVRPTFVVGPYDYTYRFTWWVMRVARGGEILAPGPRENPFQVIDGRDLANFVVRLASGEVEGTFHTVSPTDPCTFEEFMEAAVDELGPEGTSLTWVEPDELLRLEVPETAFPLWLGTDPLRLLSAVNPQRAIDAGLEPRPLRQSIRETFEYESEHPTTAPPSLGLTDDQERAILLR